MCLVLLVVFLCVGWLFCWVFVCYFGVGVCGCVLGFFLGVVLCSGSCFFCCFGRFFDFFFVFAGLVLLVCCVGGVCFFFWFCFGLVVGFWFVLGGVLVFVWLEWCLIGLCGGLGWLECFVACFVAFPFRCCGFCGCCGVLCVFGLLGLVDCGLGFLGRFGGVVRPSGGGGGTYLGGGLGGGPRCGPSWVLTRSYSCGFPSLRFCPIVHFLQFMRSVFCFVPCIFFEFCALPVFVRFHLLFLRPFFACVSLHFFLLWSCFVFFAFC